MAYLYPYGDSQQLNLSWFLAKFKELYEYVMNLDPGESSMDTILSRFTDQYDPNTTYVTGDYCIFDGYIYKANQTTSGMFNSGAWDPALPVNDIQGLRVLISQLSQSVEDLEEDAVTNVQYTPGAATANGLLRQTVNGSASTVMTVDKEPTKNSQNPVKSGSVYEELTELKGSLTSNVIALENLITPYIENGNTASRTYGQRVFVIWKGVLYKVIASSIAQGASFVVDTNIKAVTINDMIWLRSYQIPSQYFSSLVTVSANTNMRKYGEIIEIYLELTANAEIPAWTQILTGLPNEFCPYQTNGAFTININDVTYAANFNASGVLNTPQAIPANGRIRFKANYLTQTV